MIVPSDITGAVAAVCPIDGIRFGDLTDKTTWAIWPQPSATDAQIVAAQGIIDNWVIS